MAGKGFPPKGSRSRPRDESRPTRLRSKGSPKPPALPKTKLLPATRTWWRTWVESEQSQHFTATDWQRLLMLVPLVDAYWREPSKDLLGEIRLNESKLGATAEDRMRLRWKLEAGEEPVIPTRGLYDDVEMDS